ncbi:factor associated with metabolism and energy-like [Liolophura sinensis]|uniref:factor associated with metabolism and energy-like n=1 Tax=Liolophura sinensis TaxID=3198878 RepID=UPI0031585D5C
MGCASSTAAVSPAPVNNNPPKNGGNNNHTIKQCSPLKESKVTPIESKNTSSLPGQTRFDPGPKGGIAFDVSLDGNKVNSLILKHPPKKLQRLEPLNHPKLSADMLLEKQKIAEEKRQHELQKKREVSQKGSRRRRDLLRAREFEREQTSQQIEDSLKTADEMRAAKQKEIIEKQKKREERAKRVRQRAKQMNEAAECDIPELEKDETFNAEDDEDWNDDSNYDHGYYSGEKTHLSGRSPTKRVNVNSDKRLRNITSASTVDSVDNAFLNHPRLDSRQAVVEDDFFDT